MSIRPLRTVLLLLSLAAAGCSLGSNPGSPAGPKPPTPKSVSPGSIAPAPMAKTAILPSNAMRSPIHPDSAMQGLSWSQISGSATQVAASSDGSIWVLSDQPSGGDKYIWHYASGTWTNISGMAAHLAVAPNGTLYAVNAGGGTYSYSGGTWTALGGGASGITAAADGSIYVLSNGGSDADKAIWHNAGGTWSQVPGSGVTLGASWDTGGPYSTSGGTVKSGGFYILNSSGAIWYENTDGTFAQLPGSASAVAAWTNGGVFVLGYPTDPNGTTIYYYDLNTPGWSAPGGAGVSIGESGTNLYAIGASGGIYFSATTAIASATPFPTPAATPNLNLSCNTSPQRCGVQRWRTKTLDDVDEHLINWLPQQLTATQLGLLPVPSGYNENGPGGSDNGRFAPYEEEVFTVRALLITRKHETGSSGDDDYHIEITDPDNVSSTMVTEAPHGECTYACASGFGGYYDSIRNWLDTCFGPASGSFQSFPAGVIVNMTGVGFFDGLHGQTGARANPGGNSNFELHPVVFMEFVSGKPNVAGCTQTSGG